MGIINLHESNDKCDRCGKKVKLTYLVYGDKLCENCYEVLGGIDYKEALDELDNKTIGKGFPSPKIETEGWR